MFCVAFHPLERNSRAYRLNTGQLLELGKLTQSESEENAWNTFDQVLNGSKRNGKVILYRYYPGGYVWHYVTKSNGRRRKKRVYRPAWTETLCEAIAVGR